MKKAMKKCRKPPPMIDGDPMENARAFRCMCETGTVTEEERMFAFIRMFHPEISPAQAKLLSRKE